MASYFGTSGTVTQSTQVRWIAVAVGAVAVAGVGNATWLAAGARSIRTRRHDSHGRLLGVVELEAARPSMETVGVSSPVATEAMAHYHRADCIMVAAKAYEAATVDEHQQSGRQPCPICRP